MNQLSAQVASFIAGTSYDDLPADAVEKTKQCILDAVGVSLAASSLGEGCRAFIDLAIEQGGREQSTILGAACKVPSEAAAFVNGALAHALDYEDSHDIALIHPNAPTVPAALALAEAFGPVSGKELITAVAVGCDVAVRMSLALEASIAEFGWYPPPILAAFGATAAAAKILRLNEQQVRDALSLALCQATCSNEIIYSPHSVIRAVRDAFAARAGVTSALLARRGIRGFDEPLEGRAGFFAAFARGQYVADRLTRNLGQVFEIANVSFKPWPSCRGTHAAIEAALKCREGVAVCDIENVTIHGGPMLRMLAEPRASKIRPQTAIDAKFSLPFTVATALAHGRVGLQSFQPECLADEQILELAARVEVSADAMPGTVIGARLRIRARGCIEREMTVLAPLGSPTNAMSRQALIEKFIECAGLALHPLGPDAASRLADRALSLEELADIGVHLMPLLR